MLAGLIALTACASPEPPLPDSSTLARQLLAPAALVFEVACLCVVLAGLFILLTYHPEKYRRDTATAAVPTGSTVAPGLSASLATSGHDPAGMSTAQELRTPIMATPEQEQEEPEGGVRTSEDQKRPPLSALDYDGSGQFAVLADSDDEAEDAQSGVRSTVTCFRAALHVSHHVLLPATAGVLGAAASKYNRGLRPRGASQS